MENEKIVSKDGLQIRKVIPTKYSKQFRIRLNQEELELLLKLKGELKYQNLSAVLHEILRTYPALRIERLYKINKAVDVLKRLKAKPHEVKLDGN